MIFTEGEVDVVHTWPNLEAARKLTRKPAWKPFLPRFRLLRPKLLTAAGDPDANLGPPNVASRCVDPAFEKLSAFLNFRRSIPAEIAAAVEGFSNRQFALLRMCQERKQARDLLQQSPALGFSVAHHNYFRPTWSERFELAASVSRLKQRDIARWLGFPGSQAWANIVSKIPAAIVSLETVVALRNASANPEVEEFLCHSRTLNAGSVALILDPRKLRLLAPKLLEEVAAMPAEHATPQTVHLLDEIVGLHTRMGIGHELTAFRSIEEIRRKQQEAADQLVRYLKRLQSGEFPEPPLPETEHIIPLVNEGQLEAEGQAQHHCVGCYGPKVAAGDWYVYRVMSPQRATLCITKGPDGCWSIQQLYLACNRPASPGTWGAV